MVRGVAAEAAAVAVLDGAPDGAPDPAVEPGAAVEGVDPDVGPVWAVDRVAGVVALRRVRTSGRNPSAVLAAAPVGEPGGVFPPGRKKTRNSVGDADRGTVTGPS